MKRHDPRACRTELAQKTQLKEVTSSRINYIKQCQSAVRAIYAFESTLAHCTMEALFRELIKLRHFPS
jgi:hypothetical protein